MAKELESKSYAIFDRRTGQIDLIGDDVVLIRPYDILRMEDDGDIPDEIADALPSRLPDLVRKQGAKIHRLAMPDGRDDTESLLVEVGGEVVDLNAASRGEAWSLLKSISSDHGLSWSGDDAADKDEIVAAILVAMEAG